MTWVDLVRTSAAEWESVTVELVAHTATLGQQGLVGSQLVERLSMQPRRRERRLALAEILAVAL